MDPQKPPGPYSEPPPPYTSAPPPSSYNPPPGAYAGGYPPKSSTVVVGAPHTGPGLTSVTVVNVSQWGPYPMQMTCPRCAAQVMTETTASPGLLTWILSGSLIFLGCWFGCCLIPCCIPECQDIEHRCPNCKHHLGSYRRL
ncbi:LITAF domain-containing protein-like isoform X4 [Tachypleus tridentatus]|uniref:LITAF domain-containing protein-like isoform X4 n=1 Tax=Tachypleus tridentatus TaxID=6853 RepID=UPI003FD27E7A